MVLSTPQSWSTCKSWSTSWGGTPKLSFFGWFFTIFNVFHQFSTNFGLFFVNFCFNKLLGARSTQKLVEINNKYWLRLIKSTYIFEINLMLLLYGILEKLVTFIVSNGIAKCGREIKWWSIIFGKNIFENIHFAKDVLKKLQPIHILFCQSRDNWGQSL